MDINTIAIISSIASLVVSIGAVALAITFYVCGRNTEIRVSTSLAEIKTQTNSLQKLSGKQIDKLMEHAFGSTNNEKSSEITQQLLLILKDKPNSLTQSIADSAGSDQEQLIMTLYIVLYFYTSQTNYWSQFYLPRPGEFDTKDQYHQLVKRIVDSSCSDFSNVAAWLGSADQEKLLNNNLRYMLDETKNDWRNSVRSTADIFIKKEHEQ